MDERKTDKKFVSWYFKIGYAIAVIIVIVALVLMWGGYGQFTDSEGNPAEFTSGKKIIFTVVFIVVLIAVPFIFRLLFRHQERVDRKQLNTSQTMR